MAFIKNKRGLAVVPSLTLGFFAFGVVLMLGILTFVYYNMAVGLDQDIVVTTDGRTLADLNSVTFGAFEVAFLENADLIGLALIFGTIISLFISAFYFRGQYPTLFIIIDIILLIVAFIIATYIGYTYQMLMNSASELSFFIDYLPKSSTFVLYLNIYVAIIGVLMMILSYSMFPADREAPQVREYEGGY